MSDNINHPSHYAEGWSNGSEVIDITEHLNFNRGNAVKYLARAGKKNPDNELEDLYKAQWYINRELKRVELRVTADKAARDEEAKQITQQLAKHPRTWRSLADVPDGKIVTDKEGDEWYRDNADRYHYRQGKDSEGYGYLSEWRRSPDPIEVDDAEFGPFTEVIA